MSCLNTEVLPVTVAIPVKNEELNLPRCLAALQRFERVVVIDSASTDKSAEIASDANAELIDFRWNGLFPKKRNWFLMNYSFTTKWVLFLDADEIVTDGFCDALAAALQSGAKDAYWLCYRNYFMGKRLRFGVTQRKLALIKVGSGSYERIDENNWSELDMEIHEHPIIAGPIGLIRTPIEHHDYRGLIHFLNRHLSYARWEASRYFGIQKADKKSWTRRQQTKYKYLKRWWFPPTYFVYTYFIKLGLLDGAAGYQYALYKYWYFNTIRQLILEDQRPRT